MPTPGQMAAGQQSTIPRELLEQMPQQRGAIMGAGHAMTQSDGVMAARLLPEPDLQADPCSADGTQTDYYTAGTVRRLLAAERERIAGLIARHFGLTLETLEYLETMRQGPTPQEWAAMDRCDEQPKDTPT